MPYADSSGVRIHWTEQGQGEPVLLIMGLAYSSRMWHRVAPRLAERYRVILVDNRGVPQSDVPGGPYPIGQMAEDAAVVLDAAGVSSAHVLGASMGGMIAQELTLRHPYRVRSLALGCTAPYGLLLRGPNWPVLFRSKPWNAKSLRERLSALAPLLYHPQTPRDRIEEDFTILMRSYPSRRGYLNQFLGILGWRGGQRLKQIRVPTLVVHGDSDNIIQTRYGREVAELIPNSRLQIIKNAGHVFSTDQPDLGLRPVFEFLAEQSGRA